MYEHAWLIIISIGAAGSCTENVKIIGHDFAIPNSNLVYAYMGQRIHLECVHSKRSNHSVSNGNLRWKKSGDPFEWDDYVLDIRVNSESQSGLYFCVAENSAKSEAHVRIFVQSPYVETSGPDNIVESQEYADPANRTLKLISRLVNPMTRFNPTENLSTVIWYFNGNSVNSNANSKYHVTGNESHSMLTVGRATGLDAGIYTAEFGGEENRKFGLWAVGAKPVGLGFRVSDVTGNHTKRKELSCEFFGFPRFEISWTLNHHRIRPRYSSRAKTHFKSLNGVPDSMIAISPTRRKSHGLYECCARNDFGMECMRHTIGNHASVIHASAALLGFFCYILLRR